MMIGFLAAVMTTACLFFAWVIDTYLFSVPTLSKVMNEASANMVMAATGWKIAWIAVIVFLFLSVTSFGYTYIRGLYNQLISGFQDREWKMFSQMIWKIAVAFLIFLSVAWVVPFGKAFNYTATYLYTTIVTPFGKDDVELMRTKPIQTLVEVALLLPTDDIDMDGNPIPPYANAAERDKHKFDAILEK